MCLLFRRGGGSDVSSSLLSPSVYLHVLCRRYCRRCCRRRCRHRCLHHTPEYIYGGMELFLGVLVVVIAVLLHFQWIFLFLLSSFTQLLVYLSVGYHLGSPVPPQQYTYTNIEYEHDIPGRTRTMKGWGFYCYLFIYL